MKYITIMGSTGSIGTQTLDIIERHPDLFKVDVLTAGSNVQLLAAQALRHKPRRVVIADESAAETLRTLLSDTGIEICAGVEALSMAGCSPRTDIVVGALVGFAGLRPTLNAIRKGKTIALANKETLVVAGEIMTSEARHHGVKLLPVDSEHSAIFQCLQGECNNRLQRIFLTASGGPFRQMTREQMRDVTVEQALCHPNWKMGAKVTIDSASMMNKGFEMIEACRLFDCRPEQIEVVVHPQSIVHSMVEFADGSVKAQLGLPDMRLPIGYALGYPERLNSDLPRLQVGDFASLTFESPDTDKFPLLRMAYEAINRGGNATCILNAANEIAVRALLNHEIQFSRMSELVEKTMQRVAHISQPTLDDIFETHEQATESARVILREMTL